jgi:hypothetical protein
VLDKARIELQIYQPILLQGDLVNLVQPGRYCREHQVVTYHELYISAWCLEGIGSIYLHATPALPAVVQIQRVEHVIPLKIVRQKPYIHIEVD